MKARIILMVVVALSALMPLTASFFSLTDIGKFMEMFKVPASEGTAPLVVVLSACFVAILILHVYILYKLWRKETSGINFAILMGWIQIASGIILFIRFRQIGFDGDMMAMMDGVKGAIIIALGYWALKQEKS